MSHPVPGARPVRSLRLLLVTDSLKVGGRSATSWTWRACSAGRGVRGHGGLLRLRIAETLEEAGVPVAPSLDRKMKRRVGPAYARRLVRGAFETRRTPVPWARRAGGGRAWSGYETMLRRIESVCCEALGLPPARNAAHDPKLQAAR